MKEMFKCPRCGSSQTRHRFRTNDRICYICGNIWKIEIENGDGGEIGKEGDDGGDI